MNIVIKTYQGLEDILAAEVEAIIGIKPRIGRRAVFCEATRRQLYQLNYELRTAVRILVELKQSEVETYDDLYQFVSTINWSSYLDKEGTFSIDSTVFSETMTNSQFALHRTKDAIVDQFNQKYGVRPSVDTDNPSIVVNLHISHGTATISLDSSGVSLHIRGYRTVKGLAPLSEVLAAGMIKMTSWDYKQPFFDPMCGSGTILFEAALMALDIPPQFKRRHFAFMNWDDYNQGIFKDVKREANSKSLVESPLKLYGLDDNEFVYHRTRKSYTSKNFLDTITLELGDFFHTKPPVDSGIIVTNPPYDMRLKVRDVEEFYKRMGDKLKQDYKNWDVWVLSGNAMAMKRFGLRTSSKRPLLNGKIQCTFNHYEIY